MDCLYVRERIPAFEIPSYEGQRYEAMVPATLDLQERAALAINGLTARTDPEYDYEIYYATRLGFNPPHLLHWKWDVETQMWYHAALPLLRLMSGSDQNSHIEERWTRVLLHMQGLDGLLWTKVEGRPWLEFDMPETIGVSEGDRAMINETAWGLTVLSLYYNLTGDPMWKETGERVVQGLMANVVDKGDYAYFPTAVIPWSDPQMPNPHLVSHGGWVVHGLVHFFLETGYEPGLELAGKLVRCIKDHANFFGPDGSFLPCRRRPNDEAHFYAHCHSLLETTDYALAAGGDKELLEFARSGFEFARAHGEGRMGYFPELLFREHAEQCETCGLADVIGLGMRLSVEGLGDYWDDVDRWVRNQYAEMQMLRGDWIERWAWLGPRGGSTWVPPDPRRVRVEGMGEACVGTFGMNYPNDWGTPRRMGTTGICCAGTGSRALYYVWEHILTHEDGKLRVNLLLNRASPWADVDSYLPYEGQVDVKVKESLDLSVRIPEWVKPQETACRVNGEGRPLSWDGRYALVGEVLGGDSVGLTFPIEEHSHWVTIEKRAYNLVCKGNEVVSIEPPGTIHPLYQREHYRDNAAHWKKVTRFVSDQSPYW